MRKSLSLAVVFLLVALAWWAQAKAQAGERPESKVWSDLPPVARLLGKSGGEFACRNTGGTPPSENALPGFDGAYVNQIALSPQGHEQCGVASAAIVLATFGHLPPSSEALASEANKLWRSYANPTYISRVVDMLQDHGVAVEAACLSTQEAWDRLTTAVDCGIPSILVSTRLTRSGSGHFFVAAGYRQKNGERQVLAYDPYGYWQGPQDGYLVNADTPDSRLGEGVFYNFDDIWGYGSENCAGGYLLTFDP